MSGKQLWLPFLICLPLLVQQAHADGVDDYVRKEMDARHIPGVMLLVQKDGKILKQQAYGLANIELGIPIAKDSVFPLASVTKVFTATAVYLLVQDKKLRLEDDITQLVSLPESWRGITVLNCLSHTSGLPDVLPGVPALTLPGWISAATQEEALSKLSTAPMAYKTGERASYNQTDFLVLKMIIEKRSGMSVEEFLDQRIFRPLALTSARFGDSLVIVPKRVALYMSFRPLADRVQVERRPNGDPVASPDGKLWNDLNFLYPEYQHGGVGLNMNALDLAAFDAALAQGKLLNTSLLKEMWTPFRLNSGSEGEFAGGWDTSMLNGHLLVFHIGAGMVEYAHLVESNTTVILTNNQGSDPHRLTLGVLRFFAPETEKRPN